jgi:uncharacterized glyoxalase superfamily protein PhnB
MNQRMSLITLGVRDFCRALDFYEHGLGWKKSSASQDDVAFFPMNGIVFALYPRDLLAADATVPAAGSGFSGIALAYNTRSEQEVDEILETVQRLGATIIKPAHKTFWGGYSGYFADPEGHLWEVAHNPFWEFDENGNLILPQEQ